MRLTVNLVACLTTIFTSVCIHAQVASVPVPVDQSYPGTIMLKVDARDTTQKIIRVQESIPVKPGKLTLLYPEWLPGNHAPRGPLADLAGLTFMANGQRLEWRRDPLDVFAFHLDIPTGATMLEAVFQFLAPTQANQGRIGITHEIIDLQWNTVVLYPAGHYARQIRITPALTLPEGWKFGTALELAEQTADIARFKTTDLETLVDSPVFAGRYFKQIDLDPGANIPVRLNAVADSPASLDIKQEQLDVHRALVQQAYKLFGSQHYEHYDFLLALTTELGGIGLEHHQSTEITRKPGYFTGAEKEKTRRDVLAHEFVHSWNGKFRRPADLWTPNFNVPMQGSLLWVYEGQTQYWGYVLSARAGTMNISLVRDALATIGANLDQVKGRDWRAMQDTTNDPVINARRPLGWSSWQRSEDYYNEGLLIWLDADSKIRELSAEKRSLNDFARRFFGIENGSHTPVTYNFDDVVKALNAVQSFDWANFLHERIDGHGPGAPLDGFARAGWRLTYSEQQSEYSKGTEDYNSQTDFQFSLGFSVDKDNQLINLIWDSPAFKAGLTVGGTILAVNGRSYKAELLREAITDAKKANAPPIELLVKKDDRFRTIKLDYHDGLKYPRLERIAGTVNRLDDILKAMR